MVQSPTKYTFVASVDVDSGDTVVPPNLAPDFKTQSPSTLASGKIRHKYLVDNQTDLADFSLIPTAIDDGGGSLLDGSGYLERAFRASSDEILSGSFEVASATGVIATLVYNNVWRFSIDPSFRAGSPLGQAINASVTMRARYKRRPTQYLTWPAVTIATTGSAVTTLAPPIVIGQPAPRSFAEGVATQFTVDIASFFTVAATPAVYSVTNSDGTALTGYVLNSLVSGVATLTSPTTAGVKGIRFAVTDVQGRVNQVVGTYTVVANAPPVVVSAVTAISIDISQSGNFPLDGASVVVDPAGEALTYSLRNSDGTAPAAGYSFDGSNVAFPTEPGAVTRSFVIRGTETGVLAQVKDSDPFTFDRPAVPVVIVTAADVEFPENAATTKRIDVRTILGTDAAEAITLADGSALPARYSVVALGSGVFDVTGTFTNNQILTDAVKYAGTLAGSPVQALPSFKSIHNPPVDGLPASIDALTDDPYILSVIQQSDDPTNNLIVSGSASIDIGQVAISADFKDLTLTAEGPGSATATLSYTLEATSGGPQTVVTKTINWRQPIGPQAVIPSISTQSTDGTAPPTYNILASWTAGDHPIDPASVKFYDINGTAAGTTADVSGAGTMSISSAGVATFTQVAGFVGPLSFRAGVSDVKGNVNILDWAHTQLADPGDPPPPDTIIPNRLDGKPIMQRGIEADSPISSGSHVLRKNKRGVIGFEAVAAGSDKLWTTNLKGSIQKVLDGESDPTTGWFMLAPGESMPFPQPRPWQQNLSALANFQTGAWSFSIDVRTGDTADASQFSASWTESGTLTGQTGGQSSLINGGAAFTFTRRRFTRTLTGADTSTAVLRLTNSSGANIWVRRWWVGRNSDEATWETDPFTAEGKADLAQDKVIRIMDHCSPAGKAAFASNMVSKTDYLMTANARAWVSSGDPAVANSSLLRQGTNIYEWAKLCADNGSALHFNVPITFGMGVTSGLANGFYTSAASANPFGSAAEVTLFTAYASVIAQNFTAIVSAAKTQYRLWAQDRVQDLIDAGYPDSTIAYIEFGNEVWGYGNFPISNAFAKAVTDHLRSRTDGKPVYNKNTSFGGFGYIANLIATEVARVISEMKPNQQVKFVIGTQTNVSAGNTTQWADGWNVFSAEFPSASLPIGRLGIMTTNYLSEGFKFTSRSPGAGNPFGAQTATEYHTAYNAARAISQDNLFQIIFNWYVNPTSKASSVFGQLGQIAVHKSACDAAGMEYLGNYEGWFHEDLQSADMAAISTLIGDRNAFRDGAYGEAVIARFIQEFTALYPNGIISNYYKYVRDDNLATAGAPWFELPVSSIGTVPTAGAAKAIYDNSRQGAGSVTPPTNLDENFETATRTSLIASGWTLASGFDIFDDTGDRALYSTNEFETARETLGSALQANAIRAVRLIMRPDGTRTAEYGRLIMSSTGDYVALKPGAAGALVLTFLGQNAANAVTTTNLDLLDGSAHDLTITYYAHLTAGLVEVKRTSDNFVYGTFSGDTISTVTAGASPHIDTIEGRGKVFWRRVANLTGVVPPTPVATWDTPITLNYAAGTPAGFIHRVKSADFSTGALHEFYLRAQADGGDIRAYSIDGVTRLPLHILAFNKTAGTCDLRVRVPGALAQNDQFILRTGGDGTLTQPAASAQYGSQEVYQDFDLYTTDMLVNHKDGETFTQFGGAASTGPNGLGARGYDSQGVNAGDSTDSTLTTNVAATSCGLLFRKSAKGGGGIGVSDTGFARLFHMRDGDDLYVQDNNGTIVLEREFSTTDGKWSTPYATLNAWAGFCYSQDGSTADPIFTLNAANAAVTVGTAPVGTFVAGTTPLSMGNHNGNPPTVPLHTRNFDGRICEYWRRSATTTQAFHIAWQTMLLGLSTFVTAETGALTP